MMTPSAGNDNNTDIAAHVAAIRKRIASAEQLYGRTPGSVTLVAASKTHACSDIMVAYQAGLRHFGESYLQDALPKITAMGNQDITWHFIGAIQSNKTRDIAQHFAWAHGIDRIKIGERLNNQRPENMPPLNICVQVNVGNEQQKAGVTLAGLPALADGLQKLTRLHVRGLMVLPPPSGDFTEQRVYFRQIRQAYEQLCAAGHDLDTLSMGMSGDLEAAIAEGSTLVRVGTAIFGSRV